MNNGISEEDITIQNDFGEDDDGHTGSTLLINTSIIPIKELEQLKQQILNNQAIVEKLKQQELGLRVALSDPNLVKTDKDYSEVRRYYNNLNRFLTTTHHSERSRGKAK